MTVAWWFEGACIAVERAKCKAVIALCNAAMKLDRFVCKALSDAERTKVSSQASGHDRVEPMTPPTEYAILRNLVVGREVTTIPERLVELGFVRSEKLRSTIGMVKMVWVATRNGRLCIARSEE